MSHRLIYSCDFLVKVHSYFKIVCTTYTMHTKKTHCIHCIPPKYVIKFQKDKMLLKEITDIQNVE